MPSQSSMLHAEITDKILAAFYEVYRVLGTGFLEKVYENALAIELRQRGLEVVQQAAIPVFYKGAIVGQYFADLLVAQTVIVEIKTVEHLNTRHIAQLLHYLRATDKEVGLLLNFGVKPQTVRRIWTNDRKLHGT